MQNNTDGNKNRKLHAIRVKRTRLGTVPALQYSLLPRNNKGSLKIVYKDSRQPEKRIRVISLLIAFLKQVFLYNSTTFEDDVWLSWLERGFLGKRTLVRYSVTSTSASTFL